jgi:plastocyanin
MRLRGLLAAAVLGLALVPGAAPAAAPDLFGTVGPGFTITIANAAGQSVSRIDPGTYVLEVRDLSPFHSFHLTGPGVDESTGVEEEGTVTWTVTFREGRYTAFCDPHPSQMTKVLTVGNPPAPAPVPKPTRLNASVGPGATIALRTAGGAKAQRLKPGAYAITVRDRSTAHNFHLVGKGVNRKTAVAGTGTTTWTVRLQTGPLRFYSDRAPKTVAGSARVG